MNSPLPEFLTQLSVGLGVAFAVIKVVRFFTDLARDVKEIFKDTKELRSQMAKQWREIDVIKQNQHNENLDRTALRGEVNSMKEVVALLKSTGRFRFEAPDAQQ